MELILNEQKSYSFQTYQIYQLEKYSLSLNIFIWYILGFECFSQLFLFYIFNLRKVKFLKVKIEVLRVNLLKPLLISCAWLVC